MVRRTLGAAGLAALAAAAGAAPGEEAPRPAKPAAGMQIEEYRIGTFDLLDISVFQVQELSRTVRVDAQGLISLPMIGQVMAAGHTARELEVDLARKLAEKYLQDPQVSVFIKEYVSQRVVVEGSVQRPGVYPISGRVTLLQVIALAGGPDQVGDASSVRIIRLKPDGAREVASYDLEVIRSGSVDDPVIKGNDIVIMDKSGGRAFLRDIGEILRVITPFGMFR